ncbi:inner-membrane translocator [Streptomyces sp. NPDC001978]|uniref:inner-membrane translocator n=1 Tax=Streptomyces sp. NPDC001978 TaxID=3364627 RepID=UPI0036A34886
MPELADKQPSSGEDAFTAGCLLLLVLVADVAAGLLVLIVLAVRGLSQMNAYSSAPPHKAASAPPQTAAGAPPTDWTPVLCYGALTLAVCVTGVVLLRLGHRFIGAAQLTLCVVLASFTLGAWP